MNKELRLLLSWSDHHRRLFIRLGIILLATLVVDVIGAVLTWRFERHAHGTDIHEFGDALFFSTVQLLTISSQIKNPLTAAGRGVDVLLELWGIAVIGGVTGSFGAFFLGHDAD